MQKKESGSLSAADGAFALLAHLDLGGRSMTREESRAEVRAIIGPRPPDIILADKHVKVLSEELQTLRTELDAKKAEREVIIWKKQYSMLPAIDSEIEEHEKCVEMLKKSIFETLEVIQECNLSILEKFGLPKVYLTARVKKTSSSSHKVVKTVNKSTQTPLTDEKFDDLC